MYHLILENIFFAVAVLINLNKLLLKVFLWNACKCNYFTKLHEFLLLIMCLIYFVFLFILTYT